MKKLLIYGVLTIAMLSLTNCRKSPGNKGGAATNADVYVAGNLIHRFRSQVTPMSPQITQ